MGLANQQEAILRQDQGHQRPHAHHDTLVEDPLLWKLTLSHRIRERKEPKSVRPNKQISTKLFEQGSSTPFLLDTSPHSAFSSSFSVSGHFTSEYDTLVTRKKDKKAKANSERHQANTLREHEPPSIFDSFQLTSGNLKSFETTSNLTSFSASRRDAAPQSHPKPPLHQNHISLLDEIESSPSESDNRVLRHAGIKSSYAEQSNSSDDDGNGDEDSEGEMIFPSKPSVVHRDTRDDHSEIPSMRKINKSPQHQEEENGGNDDSPEGAKMTETITDRSSGNGNGNGGAQSDIDQRINALQKFLQKAR
jgi:hypothetical protein